MIAIVADWRSSTGTSSAAASAERAASLRRRLITRCFATRPRFTCESTVTRNGTIARSFSRSPATWVLEEAGDEELQVRRRVLGEPHEVAARIGGLPLLVEQRLAERLHLGADAVADRDDRVGVQRAGELAADEGSRDLARVLPRGVDEAGERDGRDAVAGDRGAGEGPRALADREDLARGEARDVVEAEVVGPELRQEQAAGLARVRRQRAGEPQDELRGLARQDAGQLAAEERDDVRGHALGLRAQEAIDEAIGHRARDVREAAGDLAEQRARPLAELAVAGGREQLERLGIVLRDLGGRGREQAAAEEADLGVRRREQELDQLVRQLVAARVAQHRLAGEHAERREWVANEIAQDLAGELAHVRLESGEQHLDGAGGARRGDLGVGEAQQDRERAGERAARGGGGDRAAAEQRARGVADLGGAAGDEQREQLGVAGDAVGVRGDPEQHPDVRPR